MLYSKTISQDKKETNMHRKQRIEIADYYYIVNRGEEQQW